MGDGGGKDGCSEAERLRWQGKCKGQESDMGGSMVGGDAVVWVATRYLRGITEEESALQGEKFVSCKIFLMRKHNH